jgi:hypothetical protein
MTLNKTQFGQRNNLENPQKFVYLKYTDVLTQGNSGAKIFLGNASQGNELQHVSISFKTEKKDFRLELARKDAKLMRDYLNSLNLD